MRYTIKRLTLLSLAALMATALFAAGAEAAKKPKNVPVKVMTRNIFLGADLGPALNAQSAQEFIDANGAILREVDQTNFPLRAQGLAAEIAANKPDLIGLQEVAHWRTGATPGEPHQSSQDAQSEFTATTTKYDFLSLLLGELEARNLDYEPAVVKEEFDFEAPTNYDGDPNTGVLGGEIQGRLTMRDVILVNQNSKVDATLKKPKTGTYSALFTPTISGIQVPVTRGWTAGDVTVQKGKGDNRAVEKFRFVNTHFEAFDDETQVPSIRAQQAMEVLAGPADNKRTIMLGDFNSDTTTEVQAGDAQAFQAILDAGFDRRATSNPLSCCVPDLVNGPASEFDHQVDHVVTNSGKDVKLVDSTVVGLSPVNGMFNSDHAGIVSTLKLK